MIPLLGSLETFDLPSLIRFVAQSRKTGWLRVADRRTTGEVAFADGRVVAASFGAALGPAALDAMVRTLRAGRFTFTEGAILGERTIDLAAGALEAQLAGLTRPPQPPPPSVGTLAPIQPLPAIMPQAPPAEAEGAHVPQAARGRGRRFGPAQMRITAVFITVVAVLTLLLLMFLLDRDNAIPELALSSGPGGPAAVAGRVILSADAAT